jgi:hypothetical protein
MIIYVTSAGGLDRDGPPRPVVGPAMSSFQRYACRHPTATERYAIPNSVTL